MSKILSPEKLAEIRKVFSRDEYVKIQRRTGDGVTDDCVDDCQATDAIHELLNHIAESSRKPDKCDICELRPPDTHYKSRKEKE